MTSPVLLLGSRGQVVWPWRLGFCSTSKIAMAGGGVSCGKLGLLYSGKSLTPAYPNRKRRGSTATGRCVSLSVLGRKSDLISKGPGPWAASTRGCPPRWLGTGEGGEVGGDGSCVGVHSGRWAESGHIRIAASSCTLHGGAGGLGVLPSWSVGERKVGSTL
jgi:hypothetical protein